MSGKDGVLHTNASSKICSAHFSPQDYKSCGSRILKPDAVPSKQRNKFNCVIAGRFSEPNITVSAAQREAALITTTKNTTKTTSTILATATTTNCGSQIGNTNIYVNLIMKKQI